MRDEPNGPHEQEQDGDLDWRELGTFAPRVPPGSSPPRTDLGPGGSLRAEACRARAARLASRSRLRRPSTLFAAAATAAVIGIAVSLGAGGWGGLVTGTVFLLAAAASGVVGVRLHLVSTTAEVRLTAHARVEQRLAVELETLTASGWVLLHDRVLPGGHHRLAHIAVGPSGLFLVTPLPPGPLRIVGHQVDEEDLRQLYAGSLHLGAWLRTRTWEAEQLEHAVAHALQDTVWAGPTAPVVVQVPDIPWWQIRETSTELPELPYEWSGVTLRPLSALTETVRGLPSPLSRTTVASLANTVETLCPPAGLADQESTSNKPG